MNWSHLKTVLWLRWRILANRIRRTSSVMDALFALFILLCVVASLGLGVLAFGIGVEQLPEAEPADLLKVWAALAIGFLFFWVIGLLTDLQRSDAMSFKNLLHLPLSLEWVFLYNYLSSFVSLSIAIFLPAMLGLSLALVVVHGPGLAWSFPLVLAFFGMITALTYQLRGWLARLMDNKRRGRSVVTVVTIVFVLLVQLPNLINIRMSAARRAERRAERQERVEERERPTDASADSVSSSASSAELEGAGEPESEELSFDRYASLAAMILPIGWLPYGVRATFEGRWPTGALCLVGMMSIGGWSLRRSYRSTLAGLLGSGSDGPAASSEPGDAAASRRRTPLVERDLPRVSDRVAAIASGSLQSLVRAPEAKLLLLGPVILLGFFVVMLSGNPLATDSAFGPLIVLGGTTMGLVSIAQLIQNQFGMDRAGFRAYVLSPVPRDRILLGKNLATAPLGLGIGLVALVGLEFFLVLDVSHFVGANGLETATRTRQREPPPAGSVRGSCREARRFRTSNRGFRGPAGPTAPGGRSRAASTGRRPGRPARSLRDPRDRRPRSGRLRSRRPC